LGDLYADVEIPIIFLSEIYTKFNKLLETVALFCYNLTELIQAGFHIYGMFTDEVLGVFAKITILCAETIFAGLWSLSGKVCHSSCIMWRYKKGGCIWMSVSWRISPLVGW